jgi:hypothetical protein
MLSSHKALSLPPPQRPNLTLTTPEREDHVRHRAGHLSIMIKARERERERDRQQKRMKGEEEITFVSIQTRFVL